MSLSTDRLWVPMAGFDALIDRARAGDDRAFDSLFRAWNGRLSGFVRARGVADVDGVVNDVFFSAFSSLSSFSGDEDAFRSWLFRIARNRVIDEYRKAGRAVATVELGDTHAFVGGDVVAEMDERLGGDHVVELLGLLTDEQREVLALRFVADLTIDQIAEVVGRRRGAVKQLQRRGLRRLEALLEERSE